MFNATRAMAMRPTRMMMMRQSPQTFMRQTLQMRSPVPVRLHAPPYPTCSPLTSRQKQEHSGKPIG
jgi:hypothetical protein